MSKGSVHSLNHYALRITDPHFEEMGSLRDIFTEYLMAYDANCVDNLHIHIYGTSLLKISRIRKLIKDNFTVVGNRRYSVKTLDIERLDSYKRYMCKGAHSLFIYSSHWDKDLIAYYESEYNRIGETFKKTKVSFRNDLIQYVLEKYKKDSFGNPSRNIMKLILTYYHQKDLTFPCKFHAQNLLNTILWRIDCPQTDKTIEEFIYEKKNISHVLEKYLN